MGLNFAAVLGHKIEAEGLQRLPQLLSAARAPRLAEAIKVVRALQGRVLRHTGGEAGGDRWYQ